MGLDKILPALTGMDIFLLNVEGLTNGEQLLRSKDPAVVRDELFRCPKLLDRRIQDNQDTGEILALKNIAGENGSRKGIHDGDDIERAFDLRNTMLFDVANIETPPLMTSSRASTGGALACAAPPVSA